MRFGDLKVGKPELIAAVGLIAYTIGRFLAAGGTMTEYGIDARWFLFWDAAPIPAYVWAIGRLVRGLSEESPRPSSALDRFTCRVVAFMAPYFYLFYAGATEVPLTAWILLALIIGLLAANMVPATSPEGTPCSCRSTRRRRRHRTAACHSTWGLSRFGG